MLKTLSVLGFLICCSCSLSLAQQTHTVAGTISKNGAPLPGVTVELSGNFPYTVVQTNSAGRYSYSGVPHNSWVSIVPWYPNHHFQPTFRSTNRLTADWTDANFTALDVSLTYTISGSVYVNGACVRGARVIMTGDLNATYTTACSGSYSFELIPQGSNISVRAEYGNYQLQPPSRQYTNLNQNYYNQHFSVNTVSSSSQSSSISSVSFSSPGSSSSSRSSSVNSSSISRSSRSSSSLSSSFSSSLSSSPQWSSKSSSASSFSSFTSSLAPKPQCRDGLDNDQDGLIDFPEDPDCLSSEDDLEASTPGQGCRKVSVVAVKQSLKLSVASLHRRFVAAPEILRAFVISPEEKKKALAFKKLVLKSSPKMQKKAKKANALLAAAPDKMLICLKQPNCQPINRAKLINNLRSNIKMMARIILKISKQGARLSRGNLSAQNYFNQLLSQTGQTGANALENLRGIPPVSHKCSSGDF